MHGEWSGYHRIRLGKLRAIFWYDSKEDIVYVDHIGPRGDVYKWAPFTFPNNLSCRAIVSTKAAIFSFLNLLQKNPKNKAYHFGYKKLPYITNSFFVVIFTLFNFPEGTLFNRAQAGIHLLWIYNFEVPSRVKSGFDPLMGSLS